MVRKKQWSDIAQMQLENLFIQKKVGADVKVEDIRNSEHAKEFADYTDRNFSKHIASTITKLRAQGIDLKEGRNKSVLRKYACIVAYNKKLL